MSREREEQVEDERHRRNANDSVNLMCQIMPIDRRGGEEGEGEQEEGVFSTVVIQLPM